ncbi:MAG TPA: class I SAM-dependent methyltransferase [Sedimentisphaerales bacterium]|nr:class I SAM-dependent methyltransferase [Sedimentisphaerales bacterium]
MTRHANHVGLDFATMVLACPHCQGDLAREASGLRCSKCSRPYEVHEDIPLLAPSETNQPWVAEAGDPNSAAYQKHFQESDVGPRYRQRYEKRWFKRVTTRREIRQVERLLASEPRCRRLLDIPCGGGRVSAPFAAAADLLLQADLSSSQVLMARRTLGSRGNVLWFTASVFAIPLRDGTVEGAVCNRLTHHLSPVEQERVVHELLRVSTRFVILSYYDHESFRSLGRRIRGRHPGHTIRRKDLQAWARRSGAFVDADVPLWFAGSRLRYAVLRKSECPAADSSPSNGCEESKRRGEQEDMITVSSDCSWGRYRLRLGRGGCTNRFLEFCVGRGEGKSLEGWEAVASVVFDK